MEKDPTTAACCVAFAQQLPPTAMRNEMGRVAARVRWRGRETGSVLDWDVLCMNNTYDTTTRHLNLVTKWL
jgi:hypothetical protein